MSKKSISTIIIFSFLLISCSSDRNIDGIKESKLENMTFYTYVYKRNSKKNEINFSLKTDYGLYIEPILVNEWKDKWIIEYNVYDAVNKIKYVTTDLEMFKEIIETKLPSNIILYRYIITTSWLPNGDDINSIIRNICESKNTKYFDGSEPEWWKEPDEDYINTFECIHCLISEP
jgi:hypothetical protein